MGCVYVIEGGRKTRFWNNNCDFLVFLGMSINFNDLFCQLILLYLISEVKDSIPETNQKRPNLPIKRFRH